MGNGISGAPWFDSYDGVRASGMLAGTDIRCFTNTGQGVASLCAYFQLGTQAMRRLVMVLGGDLHLAS